MKKILIYIFTLFIVATVAIYFLQNSNNKNIVVQKGNNLHKPLKVELNKSSCAFCAMSITEKTNTSQIISPDGKTWFFDDIGCMIKWLNSKNWKDKATIWVYSIDTNRWIDAKKAFYGTHDKTAMHYGFGAREKKFDGAIDFNEVKKRVLNGK